MSDHKFVGRQLSCHRRAIRKLASAEISLQPKSPGGLEAVVRPAVERGRYFRGEYGGGRGYVRWPEKLLAWATYWRIRLRGGKGGMFFVDRTRVYADQLDRRRKSGLADELIAKL